jgi:hypothetical protein
VPKATQPHTTHMPAPDVARVTPGRRGLLGGAVALLAGAGAVTLPRITHAAGRGPAADHRRAIYVGDGSSGFLSQKRRPCLETVSKPISMSKRTASACVGSLSTMRNCSIAAASDFEILACN